MKNFIQNSLIQNAEDTRSHKIFFKEYLKKIDEGRFFRISFYKLIYIFLKNLSQELSKKYF